MVYFLAEQLILGLVPRPLQGTPIQKQRLLEGVGLHIMDQLFSW